MITTTRYPNVQIALVGEDGNAFSILARAARAMRKAGVSNDEITSYNTEATSGDYDNLLRVTMSWVSCDTETEDLDEDDWYAEHPHGCYDCKELYAVGGCPSCGDDL